MFDPFDDSIQFSIEWGKVDVQQLDAVYVGSFPHTLDPLLQIVIQLRTLFD